MVNEKCQTYNANNNNNQKKRPACITKPNQPIKTPNFILPKKKSRKRKKTLSTSSQLHHNFLDNKKKVPCIQLTSDSPQPHNSSD